MKPDLTRIKDDLETMQKALGLAPAMGRDWIQWMKRDQWVGLWWSLPGLILIASALLPLDRTARHWGLVPDQWAGLLVCAILLALAGGLTRKVMANDGRPEEMIREAKRVNGISGQGLWFNAAMAVQLLCFFIWGNQYGIAFKPFWAGLFIVMGSSLLVGAVAARTWTLLGWAIPFLGYGLCLPLVEGNGTLSGVFLGLMFIAVALSFSVIAVLEIRIMERRNDSD